MTRSGANSELVLLSLDVVFLFCFCIKHKHMTQWRWEIHRHGKGEKIKKSNWIPICPAIRSFHYFWPGVIWQLPIQSKHSRSIMTWTNGMSLWMCLFIHRVRWNMKTAALNWFCKEKTVMDECCSTRYFWMESDMEIFQCSQGLYKDFYPALLILDYYGDQGFFRQHTEMFTLLKAIIL